jgi:hypothetical protein
MPQAHDPGPAFRALHRPGEPFILANAWDAGSVRMLAGLGAQALATSSAAHAFTLGRPDMGHVTREEALAHAEVLVSATPLPVSGDFENGFGDAPETCAETVRLAGPLTARELSAFVDANPDVGRAVVLLHRAWASARASLENFAERVLDDGHELGGLDRTRLSSEQESAPD